MRTIDTIEALAAYDSVELYPKQEAYAEWLDRLQRATRRFIRDGRQFTLEDSSGYQDGSLLTRLIEEASAPDHGEALICLEFSRYGALVACRAPSHATGADIVEILCRDYGFAHVPDNLLSMPYRGIYEKGGCSSWRDRLFSPWYADAHRMNRIARQVAGR